jgi:ABC-type multidrug transport system fused ATPase/permease subunit
MVESKLQVILALLSLLCCRGFSFVFSWQQKSGFCLPDARDSCSVRWASTQETEATAPVANKKRQQDYARGAALLMEDVAISRGNSQILKDINFRVEPKTKWGLIGPNGSGEENIFSLSFLFFAP